MPPGEDSLATGGTGADDVASPPANQPEASSCERRLHLAFIGLLAGSGCAALIYEVVWFQMLELVIGSTAISIGVLLVSFMGGLCLGSLLAGRVLKPRIPAFRTWALLEAGIGLLGVAVLFGLPWLAGLYAASDPGGTTGFVFRAILCLVCLLPPTVLMGATLPTVSRVVETNRAGVAWMGLVYGANTLGAVVGALLAGFCLLRLYDVHTATWVAVGVNGLLAAIGLCWPSRSYGAGAGDDMPAKTRAQEDFCSTVQVVVGLSGMCALGAEVIWTRLLSLMLGGTTYTFSIILGVFLLGLGLGSAVGSFLARESRAPGRVLGICQLLLAGAIAWAAYILARSLPYWPISPNLSKSIWFNFQLDLLRCLYAILPATVLWGASFPLGLAAAGKPGHDPGRLVGRLYAVNTLGAIFGALVFSTLLITWIGTQQAQRALILVSAISGGLMLLRSGKSDAQAQPLKQPRTSPRTLLALLGAAGAASFLVWSVPPLPWPLVAYGRYLPGKSELGTPLYVGEGMNASVAVTELSTGVRNFHVSGKIEASSDQRDMRLQRMLGHIPALFHVAPRSVLVVGCGAGVTAGSFLTHPGLERLTLCEIEPLIPKVVANFFAQENHHLLQDPRVRLVFDDARHFVLTTREKFDVITSDPIHPWVKGAASLYTKEYFELCRRHLKPGGMVTQWVPLYESNLAVVRSEIATFFEVFPDGTIWSNDDLGEGYDLVLLGQVGPLLLDVDALQQRLSRLDHRTVAQSLRDVGFRSAFSLAATYAGQARDLKPWLQSAQINRDRNLRLQYLAGMGLNFNESGLIFTDIESYCRFPEGIFTGSNIWNDALRKAMEHPKKDIKDKQPAAPGRTKP
jgi:spermidine synthase